MGFLLDTFSPIIQMLMYVLYGVYIVLGLVLVIVGIASLSKKLLTSFCIGVIIVGVFMMLVGGGAIYVTLNSNWLLMLIILVVDLALFLVLFSTAVTALFISVGGGDPVDYLMDEYWADLRAADGYLKERGGCYLSAKNDVDVGSEDFGWASCTAFYNDGADISEECWDEVYGYGGNCTEMAQAMQVRAYNDLSQTDTDYTTVSDYWEITSATQIGDDYLTATGTLPATLPTGTFTGIAVDGSCTSTTATLELCRDCWQECKENNVELAKNNMQPAAIASLAIFFYFVITAALNSYSLGMVDEDEEGEEEFAIGGIFGILVYVLNGIVAVLGLTLIVVGLVVLIKTNKDCPLEPQASCPTTAILMIIIVGGGVFLTGALVIVGAVIKLKLLIVVANLVFTVLCLALLLITTGVGLAAGVLGEASTQYDDNWKEARDNIRKTGVDEVLDFCQNAESSTGEACTTEDYENDDNGCNKNKDECIDEITELVEEYASTFAIVGIAVSVFMLVIMWFSYLSVRVWRSEGDDDDDDDDDE